MSIEISSISDNNVSNINIEKRNKDKKSESIFDCVDKYSFDILKSPVKSLSETIDQKYNDSKTWSFIKGLGDVADFIFSSEGLLTMGATILALKGINKAAVKLGGKTGSIITHEFIKNVFISWGGLQIGQGASKLVKKDQSNEEIRKAGEDIGNGALFMIGGYKMKTSSIDLRSKRNNLTPDELKLQITEQFAKICEKLNIPETLRPKLEIIENNSTIGGSYIENRHTIQFNTKGYLDGIYRSIEEIIGHEAEHARQSIYKARLSEVETDEAVKNVLLDRILNGEPEKILVSSISSIRSMMYPPRMSAKMRAEYAKFVKDEVFGENSYAYFNEFIHHQLGNSNLVMSKILQVKINEILTNNPDFVKAYGETIARSILTEYTWSNLCRYHEFACTDYGELSKLDFSKLNPEEGSDATNIIKDHIETREGNYREQYFKDSNSYDQYYHSAEEIAARIKAAEIEISELETKPKTQENIEKLKLLKFEIKCNEAGRKYYKLYTESLNNPEDLSLKKELTESKKEYDKMHYKSLRMRYKLNYTYDFKYSPIIGNPHKKMDWE